MFIITPQTVTRPDVLRFSQMPRRFLGYVFVWPRGEGDLWLKLRLLFEVEALRYVAALSPFVLAVLIWQNSGLAIAGAPMPMVLVAIWWKCGCCDPLPRRGRRF